MRISLDERVTDDLHIGFGVLNAHPQVRVNLTVNMGAENSLRQLVDRGSGMSQKAESRRWGYLGEGFWGHPHDCFVGVQTLLGTYAATCRVGQDCHCALVDVGRQVCVSLIDNSSIGKFRDRSRIGPDSDRQGLGAERSVALGSR